MKLHWKAAAVISAAGACLLPGARKMPLYKRTQVGEVMTLDDAVRTCRESELEGWALVAHAQQLVARKFAVYSTRNLWDPPSRAFAFGHGYCTQYNLALKQLLERLGFAVEAVHSLRVEVLDDPTWRLGHTWLRVTYGGETRDVCAGQMENLPGDNGFRPLWPVWRGNDAIFFLTHLGMIPFCGLVEWKGVLTGRDPGWTYQPRDDADRSIQTQPPEPGATRSTS